MRRKLEIVATVACVLLAVINCIKFKMDLCAIFMTLAYFYLKCMDI